MTLLSPVAQGIGLNKIEVHGVELDICPVSGGIWFDNHELGKFDEAHESEALDLESIPFEPGFEVDSESLRISPRHPDLLMQRRVFGIKQSVEIDVCPMSGGIWLDRGELTKIRELYPNAKDKEALADAFAANYVANHTDGIDALDAADAKLAFATRFRNFFRWICPSTYGGSRQSINVA